MAKNENKKQSMFSQAFVRAIAGALREPTADGSCVKMDVVANTLRKQRAFCEENAQLLKLAIGRAIHNGEVPGYAAKRGPGGGAYRIAAVSE